ncbi:MAG: HD domain-containing protein [Eubacteriales bacterium]
MVISLPPQVETVINILAEAGFKTYVVGGCVRDCIMGITPLDWDIATEAKPAEIAKTFIKNKVIETGIKHGTLTVVLDGLSMEITTFRIDGEYTDNRRPDSVEFTSDLMLDLSRRDFTMNALAYSPEEGVVDGFGGAEDIKNKIVRCVGNADIRFGEDALRIIRGLRFASVLDIEIEEATADSIISNCHLLKKIEAERILKELIKLICGTEVERINLDYREVLFQIIPELEVTNNFDQCDDKKHIFDVYGHIAHSVSIIKNEPELRMTMLLHDSGKPACFTLDEKGIGCFHGHAAAGEEIARKVLQDLKFSKKFTEEVTQLIHYHDIPVFENPKALKKWLGKLGEQLFRKFLLVKRADLLSLSPSMFDRVALVDELEVRMNHLLEDGFCLSVQDLKVNGTDLINIGMPAGIAVGAMLERLFDEVVEDKIKNDRSDLLEAAKGFIGTKK